MQNKLIKLMLIWAFLPLFSLAQTKVIKGVVAEKAGSIPGATIIEKGLQNNGVVADVEGRFQITLKGSSQVLIVRAVGYLSQEVNVAGKTSVQIELIADAKGLEEVVVVGFGQQKKITNTGAVSSISAKEIRQNPTASIQNTLAGRLPGFTAQQRTGQPGKDGATFFIRGISTFNGNTSPLIIVDDVEYSYDKVAQIDPNEVETISILKDASTTAVYGIKGANGVLVITTRRGQAGRPSVNLRQEVALQELTFKPNFLNSYESKLLSNEYYRNIGDINNKFFASEADLAAYRDGTDPYGHPDIDWYSTLFNKNSLQSRTNLDFQGGTESVKYFVSMGYLWQNGMVKDFSDEEGGFNNNYYYKRYNFRSNLDIQATKTLSLRLDLTGRFGETNEPITNSPNGNGLIGEIYSYSYLPSWAYPIYNPDGSYGYNPLLAGTNVVGRLALLGYNRTFDNDLNIVTSANQKLNFLTEGLSAKVLVSYSSAQSYSQGLSRSSFPMYYYNPDTQIYLPRDATLYRIPYLASSYSNTSIYRTINVQGALNWDRTFGQHHLYGLALLNQNSAITSTTVTNDGPGIATNSRGVTFRTGYDFKRKYLFEFNAAYNGTDRFVGTKKFGWFPAVSAGWNVAEEKFFSNNLKFIDLFKIRGSYGIVGSDGIGGAYQYEQTYSYNSNYSFGTTSTTYNGIMEGTLGNSEVTWEKEKKMNIGFDMNLFKGKVTITADYFNNDRYDILTTRASVPNTIGIGLPPVNLGRVNNRGFDGEIGFNGKYNDFNFGIRGTFSYAKNKILYMDEAQPSYPWLASTGQSIGQYFGWHAIGFYTQTEINDPSVAKPTTAVMAGDLKYEDLNGDGIINDYDKGVIGQPNLPNTTYGANFNFGYKGFSLNLFFQGAYGYSMRFHSETIVPMSSNFQEIHLQRWTPETAETAQFPRLNNTLTNWPSVTNNFSDFWTRDSYYLRLKTAEISYQLPNSISKRLKVKGIRIYANGNNLITWTNVNKFYQVDPEAGNSTTSVYGVYPTQRVYNFGLNVNF